MSHECNARSDYGQRREYVLGSEEVGGAFQYPAIARRITSGEYGEVTDILSRLGMENGWLQELESSGNYLPDFEAEGHPFESSR